MYESKEDLISKVDYEGGLVESIFGYGVSSDELPKDTPPSIRYSWAKLEAMQEEVSEINAWLWD